MQTDGKVTPEELARSSRWKGYELVAGIPSERPSSIESSWVGGQVGSLLGTAAMTTGEAHGFSSSLGYRCFPHDTQRIRCPRFTLVRTDRLAGLDRDGDYMPIPPDLAVEVVAPLDISYAVEERLLDYRLAGFSLVWVIHPNVRTVTVYRAGHAGFTLLGVGDEIKAEPALAEFQCRVGAFFDLG